MASSSARLANVISRFLTVTFTVIAGCGEVPPLEPYHRGIPCPAGYLLDHELTCVPKGCGYGAWGNLEISEDTVHVDAHATSGGEGSADAPFASIQAGLDDAGDKANVHVVVAAGTYSENLRLTEKHNGLQLAGRCSELVVLDASSGGQDLSGIRADGLMGDEAWSVSGVTVSGAPSAGIWLNQGTLVASSLTVAENHKLGVFAEQQGSELELRDTVVRDTLPLPDGTRGRGVGVEAGASLVAEDCLVEGSAEIGIYASGGGTSAHLSNVSVTNTKPLPDGTMGRGINVQDGASLLAEDCLVEGNVDIGIFASGEVTTTHLSNVEVTETLPEADGTGGRGINVQGGAYLQAENCWVEGNVDIGIFVHGSLTTVLLSDVDVKDTQPLPDGTSGKGLSVSDGATLQADDCRVEGNTGIGILANGEGAAVHLSNVDVTDTEPRPDGTMGRGVNIQDGASLLAEDCLIEGNADIGIVASGDVTTAYLSNVEVKDTQPSPDGTSGEGIHIQQGAFLQAETCRVEGNTEVGIGVSGDVTTVLLSDVDVTDTQPLPNGTWGRGISVQDGASLVADDCVVEGNSDAGIIADGEGTMLRLSNVDVTDTQPEADGAGGRGIAAQSGASLHAETCLVEGNAEIGIYVSGEGTKAHLSNIEVRETHRAAEATVGVGVVSDNQALVTLSDAVVTGCEGPGLLAADEGKLVCARCDLLDNAFAGVLVWPGGHLELSNSTIAGNSSDANEGGGTGIFVFGDDGPSTLLVEDSLIEAHSYAAVWLAYNGSYELRNNTLVGGTGFEDIYPNGETFLVHGDGVVATGGLTAWDGETGLLLEGNEIRDAYRAGVILDDSSALLSENSWSGNATDLIWQDCEGTVDPFGIDEVPVVDYCPYYQHKIAPMSFEMFLVDAVPLD